MPLHRKFQPLAQEIQSRHQFYFDALPADPERLKSIEGHYYIVSGASSASLRFQTDSDLPAEIRKELEDAFEQFYRSLPDNWFSNI